MIVNESPQNFIDFAVRIFELNKSFILTEAPKLYNDGSWMHTFVGVMYYLLVSLLGYIFVRTMKRCIFPKRKVTTPAKIPIKEHKQTKSNRKTKHKQYTDSYTSSDEDS